MNKQLEVTTADIKTATIEVKVITVSKRKMTLSVFRQIKEEDIIDGSTHTLKGVPWGLVNYFWGDHKDFVGLHVVWQKGSELRRALVRRHVFVYRNDWATEKTGDLDLDLHERKHFMEAHNEKCLLPPSMWAYIKIDYGKGVLVPQNEPEEWVRGEEYTLKKLGCEIFRGERPNSYGSTYTTTTGFQHTDSFFNDVLPELRRWREEGAAIEEAVATAREALADAKKEYTDLYETLAALDHLFIAV